MSRRWAGCLLLSVVAVAPISAADTALDWVADLPGVSVFTQKTTSEYAKTVYTVTSPDATFDRLRKGLTDRGWSIEERGSASVLGIVGARTLIAEKVGARAKFSLSAVAGLNHLSVELTPGTGSPRAGAEAEPRASSGSLPGPAPSGGGGGRARSSYDCGKGGELILNKNSQRLTIQGRCEDVTINGDSNDLLFESDCQDLTVNGDRNQIRVEGAIDNITTNGDENTVTWSAAANARGARMTDHGDGNTLRRH